uniref:Bacteriophage T5 Orf172 DNA-binding domain-containing protein n=1 Tax=Pyramimonas orientalis virus TaxID=455367 RepID=A0A7M3UP71_POV01|nr:hypothetical protein HWQ62_00407 [Pyramimonas orientalis virus]
MDNVKTYVSNNRTFYLLEDIKEQQLNVDYFTGCKSMKKCIQRQKIPDDKIVYMKNNKEYDAGYKLAFVYIEEDYVKNHILNKEEQTKKKEEEMKQRKEKRIEENKKRKEFNENEIEDAPDVLHLEDEEMFKDEEGVVMDIETRGEKTQDGIFFKASDIGKAFDYENVCSTVIDVRCKYQHGTDYKYFKIFKKQGVSLLFKTVLFLTYDGVLKVLFCSQGDRGVRFRKWASRILFTMQMGSQEDKDKLAAEALNVDVSTVKQLFRKSCRAIPCVYLFEVGTVGNMRQHFNLKNFNDDNDKVYKFGRTEDMARRAGEHQKTYGTLKDNSFSLAVFSYIDLTFVSKAETKLKNHFNNMNVFVEDDNHNELVVMNKSKLQTMKELYNNIYTQCSGNNKDLINQIQEMQLNHQNELLMNEHENELQRSKYEQTLKDKEHENELQRSKYEQSLKDKDHEQSLKDKDHEHNVKMMTMKHKNELQEVELQYMRQQLLKQ